MSLKTIWDSIRIYYRVWWTPPLMGKHEGGVIRSSNVITLGVLLCFIPTLIIFFSTKTIGGMDTVLPGWISLILAGIIILSFPIMIIGFLLYRDALGHFNSNNFGESK